MIYSAGIPDCSDRGGQVFFCNKSFGFLSDHACLLLALWVHPLSCWNSTGSLQQRLPSLVSPPYPSHASSLTSRIFISHVLQLLEKLWCPDGASPPLVGLLVHSSIAMIFNSYPLIKSLLDPTAEDPGKLVEPVYLSSGPPTRDPTITTVLSIPPLFKRQ